MKRKKKGTSTKCAKDYRKLYLSHFGEAVCELTGAPAVDIHHIQARGMGGRPSVDVIENLMALSREAHEYFGDKKQFKAWLQGIHDQFTVDQIPYIDRGGLRDQIFLTFYEKINLKG